MKIWNILCNWQMANGKWQISDFIDLLLDNRGIKTDKEKKEFLDPKLENVTIDSVGIDKKQLEKTLKRIKKAIDNNEQIVVFGDYDVDGITGSAILWETLHALGAKVLPYIPHREDEGYGLSKAGISNLQSQNLPSGNQGSRIKLIITVDNGIVAHEAVEFANQNEIDVIITDHHVAQVNLPNAHSIVHTTKLCGAGVAYLLSKEISNFKFQISNKSKIQNTKYKMQDTHLELAALGTIADLVVLTGANRAIVKHGLLKLSNTNRPGLLALFRKAGIENKTLTPYEVGFVIAPRLNAAGRIESAMDSLRLLCTRDPNRAESLAEKLEWINRERQLILKEQSMHAIETARSQKLNAKSLIFVANEIYQQGVIGLIAGKLVEEFYRPSIVLSIGEEHTKASARSVSGFNIIEFLRSHTDFFINVGGHPMAAGFTVETTRLNELQSALEKSALTAIADDALKRSLRIDCELPIETVDQNLYDAIQTLAPFGMGNPDPIFVSYGVEIERFKPLGRDQSHLKLEFRIKNQESRTIEAIGFGMGEFADNIKIGNKIDVAYAIDTNTWNGHTKLQLKIKDIKLIKT